MLALRLSYRLVFHRLAQIFCALIFFSAPLAAQTFPYNDEFERMIECEEMKQFFRAVEDENLTPHELIVLISDFRKTLLDKGFTLPPIDYQVIMQANLLRYCGLEVPDELIEETIGGLEEEEFGVFSDLVYKPKAAKEGLELVKKKKKKKKEIELSPKMVMGFLKFIAGGLCCAIPVPVIQGIGVALSVQGVSDMVDAAEKQSEDKEREEKMQQQRQIEAHLFSTDV